jgi:hypothetical protein
MRLLVGREAVPGDRRGACATVTYHCVALPPRMRPVYARGIQAYFAKAVGAGALERIAVAWSWRFAGSGG